MKEMEQLLTGAEILIECLQKQGVEIIFGYPGGVILDIYDKLESQNDIKHILVLHEQEAVHMAEGYAKATGKVGVVLVTSGPGVTNTVTGIADAFKDNIPILIIAGQVPTSLIGKDAFQEIDTLAITKSITKEQWSVRDVVSLQDIIAKAFFSACSGRPGPVLIEIPKNILVSKCDYLSRLPVLNVAVSKDNTYDLKLQKCAEILATARKPLICIGGGVINGDACEELRDFAVKHNFPVAMTLHGLGAFDGKHSLSLGMLGVYGTYQANQAVSNCDVLVGIGLRFDNRVTSAIKGFSPSSYKIHVDVDPNIIHKNVPVDLAIISDAKTFLKDLMDIFVTRQNIHPWHEQIELWARECPLSTYEDNKKLLAAFVIDKISKAAGEKSCIITDVGQHQMIVANRCTFSYPRSHITSGGLGTMGFAVPASIGAAFAVKDRPIISISGDGGFQMNMQELVTAKINKLPIKFIVMDNHSLGMIKQLQDLFHREVYGASDLENPDFVQLFKGFGYPVFYANSPLEVENVLQKAFAINDQPVGIVFDVLKEEMVFPLVPSHKNLSEMIVGKADSFSYAEAKDKMINSLKEQGIIVSEDEILNFVHIDKGLINYIFSVRTATGEFIIKHAQDKARGKPSVLIDPKRLEKEYDAINIYRRFCKNDVFPKTRFFDAKRNFLIMDKVPDSYHLLENDLKKGIVDFNLAESLGMTLADMHNSTQGKVFINDSFNNLEMIKQIKIPFIYDNITNDPQELEIIQRLKHNLLNNKICLVHGDFKPNNIFVFNADFVLIDFEQSYYGDPLLDLAYLPASYIVMSFSNPGKLEYYLNAVERYWKSYTSRVLFTCDEHIELQHLGVILLSRVDGIIKYDSLQQNHIASCLRKTAKDLILGKIKDIRELILSLEDRFKGEL